MRTTRSIVGVVSVVVATAAGQSALQAPADSRLMLDAAWSAFKAAKAKNLEVMEQASDQLYESCVSCHKAYRPDYGEPNPPSNGR